MNRKSLIIGIVVALTCVAGVAAYQYFGGGMRGSSYNAGCGYDECGYLGSVNIRPGDPYPPKCPKCGRNSVLPMAKCKKCGNRQALNEERRAWFPEMKDLPRETKCKGCGGPIVHGD